VASVLAAMDEGDPGVLHNEGLRYLNAGRFVEAANLLGRAVELAPGNAAAHLDLGIALSSIGRFPLALAAFDRAISIAPTDALAYSNKSNLLSLLRRYDEALAAADRAIALDRSMPSAHNNRGNALLNLGRLEEAILSTDLAIALDSHYADAHYNRGVLLAAFGRIDEAVDSYNEALALDPPMSRARWNRGVCELLQGNYARGLDDYEHRASRTKVLQQRPQLTPLWTGAQPLAGKTLMVVSELYLGDTIHFCRYLPILASQGARVVFSAPNPLRRLLSSLGPTVEVVQQDELASRFDYGAVLMSLPRLVETRLETIPARTPYLHPEPHLVERWRQQLGTHGFKVGVAWRGSADHGDNERSFDPGLLSSLSRVPGVRLISLQKDGAGDIAAAQASGMAVESLGDFDSGGHAFIDTAAVMQNLDLIISCDTAIAHLAGALARPIWVALKRVPDWRWLLEGDTNPWYPTMRVFRQQRIGDWSVPFDQMRRQLVAEVAGHREDR